MKHKTTFRNKTEDYNIWNTKDLKLQRYKSANTSFLLTQKS